MNMQTAFGGVTAVAVQATVAPPADGTWEQLGFVVLSAVLGAVMSWLTRFLKP